MMIEATLIPDTNLGQSLYDTIHPITGYRNNDSIAMDHILRARVLILRGHETEIYSDELDSSISPRFTDWIKNYVQLHKFNSESDYIQMNSSSVSNTITFENSWIDNKRHFIPSVPLSFTPIGPSEEIVIPNAIELESADTVTDDPLNISHQLEEMKNLQNGWADGMQLPADWGSGYGKAPDSDGLDWLAGQFERFFASNLAKPYIYPTPEGNVQAEWSIGQYEASLEIDLSSHSSEWLCLDAESKEASDNELRLDSPDSWKWLGDELLRLSEDALDG